MAIELPAAQKVHTHVYDNFKGVDFTNDSTNVWHRRSPDGVNMLPDDSGRPFKRTGWEVAVTIEELESAIGDTEILKCHYFELAGIDHVMIFCSGGVFVYREDNCELLSTSNGYTGDSTDPDCYSSYDRAFFFEGNGTAAFYIYGNYKVWVYGYDADTDSFTFSLANDGFNANEITIPTILITTDPSTCTGEMYQNYNLLGERVCVEYQGNDMCYAYSTGALTVEVTRATFDTQVSSVRGTYTFTYSSPNWQLSGVTVDLNDYGISYHGTPVNSDTIVVKYIAGILLPNNVAQGQLSGVEVYGTDLTQFDKEYTAVAYNVTPTAGSTCALITDVYSGISANQRAWLEFDEADLATTTPQEDIFRVVFPNKKVDITNYPDDLVDPTKAEYQGAATIDT